MRRTRFVAGALIVAALATVGCSNKPETPPATAESRHPAPLTPAMATHHKPVGAPHSPEAEVKAPATPAVASFADGEAAYRAKKYDEAMAIFEAYTQRRPKNAWGHYMLALSAWKHGDLAMSEQAFETALTLDPRHIKSHINLSHVLIEQNRHDEAIDRLTHAADIDPESPQILRLLGRTYHAQGRTEEAVDVYRRAIELNPRDAWSLNSLGRVFIDTHRPEEALPLLIQAVELRRGVAEFHNNLGLALEQTGHFSAAATAYDSALRVDPGYDQAKQNLARLEPQ